MEPAFNELKAVEQIERGVWSIVFAPPGLAAIAMSKQQYIPIFPMQGEGDGETGRIFPKINGLNQKEGITPNFWFPVLE